MADVLSASYIKQSKMLDLMGQRSPKGSVPSFSLELVKLSTGSIETWEECRLTSRHSAGGTINVLRKGMSAPRKVRLCLITRFNGLRVYL